LLKKYYHAVIFAYGASNTRKLGIPGEELQGVHSAANFVGWYNGLPSHRGYAFNLKGKNVVVIGNGNVALDVARILLTPPSELKKTDITSHALEQLSQSGVENVFIIGRRGVLQASFTVKELRELTQIPHVEFQINLPPDIPDPKSLPRVQQRIVQLLRRSPFTPDVIERRCELQFLLRPTRINAKENGTVTSIELEKQELISPLDPSSKIRGTNEFITLNADLIFTAIGYTSLPLAGMHNLGPGLDLVRGVIPNFAGRATTIRSKDFGYVASDAALRERVPGVYVSGWVKTGPTGVIATTMLNSFETGDSLVFDWNAGEPFLEPAEEKQGWEGFRAEVERIGGQAVEWGGWKQIEAEEQRRGELAGKEREKIVEIPEMMCIARE
jgi:adrenodoxin-NADP+ reductase